MAVARLCSNEGKQVRKKLRLQQLVTRIEKDKLTAVDPAVEEFFSAFPMDNAVVSSVDETDLELATPDDCGNFRRIWSELAHRRPSGIELVSDPAIIDIMYGKFVDAWIDEPKCMADP